MNPALALLIFGLTYLGIALGRFPGTSLDRTGIALLGANLIAVEQAGRFGVTISFLQYARLGVPVTLSSLVVLSAWLVWAWA